MSTKEIEELKEKKTAETTDEFIENLINDHYSDVKQAIYNYEDCKIKELLYTISEEDKKADLDDIQYDILRQLRKVENNIFNSSNRNGLNL